LQTENRDEAISWRVATTIMSLVTVGTIILRILGLDPFTDIFDAFIVYLPTAILVGGVLVQRMKGSSENAGYAMTGASSENKVV
jgi:hypothetical protein